MRLIATFRFRFVSVMIAALVCAVGVVWAQSPHFVGKVTAALDQDSNVVVSFKEAGLGNNLLITYEVSADATATYNCVNKGGQCPNAANKVTVIDHVTATGIFKSDKNGSVTGSLTLTPPGPGGFTCPSGQTATLSKVTYKNIKVTDTTNNVSQSATPSEFSATLFTCP
jgi:hypothetical protein